MLTFGFQQIQFPPPTRVDGTSLPPHYLSLTPALLQPPSPPLTTPGGCPKFKITFYLKEPMHKKMITVILPLFVIVCQNALNSIASQVLYQL